MIKISTIIAVGVCIALLAQWGFATIAFLFNPDPSSNFHGMVVVIEFAVWLLTGVVLHDEVGGHYQHIRRSREDREDREEAFKAQLPHITFHSLSEDQEMMNKEEEV